jgi:ABC-type Fe3+-hydroxamate transport system substrate-binding protein
MPFFTDQLNRKIEVTQIPQRIISLVPSQTELLHDLGLNEEVIGITKFCIHPNEWFRTKQRVGGTKNLDIQKIRSMNPDLIIANKEENSKEQIEELAADFPVYTSDVNNLQEALQMIEQVGSITNKIEEAETMIKKVKSGFTHLQENTSNNYIRTAYLIWKDPYMTVGGDTFINDMLFHAGFKNVFSDHNRYPEVTIEEIRIANCQVLFLSSEPYPFKQKHIDELQELLPNTKIMLADGECFSWYGSHLLQAPAYFQKLQVASIV